MKHLVLSVALVLGLAHVAAAQTVLNPTTISFTSANHNTVSGIANTPLVTRYLLNCSGSGGTPITNKDLGKPVSATTAVGPVAVSEFATITQEVIYTCTVTAEGPGGVAVSGASGPFGRPGPPPAPAAPTGVVVNP